jgi:hypothetical protein
MKKISTEKQAQILLLIALNAVALSLNIVYVITTARGFINSDTAAYSNIARNMIEARSLFPTDFYFANNDLISISPSLLIAFFALFLGYGYAPQALTVILLIIFLHFTVYKFAKFYSKSTQKALIVSGSFLAFQSSGVNQLILGNGIGMLFWIPIILWTAIIIEKQYSSKSVNQRIALFATALSFLWFAILMSPGRAALSLIIPIFAASIGRVIIESIKHQTNRKSYSSLLKNLQNEKFIVYLIILSVPAIFVRSSLSHKVLMQDAAAARGFVSESTTSTNFDNFINGIVWITGIKPQSGTTLFTLQAALGFLLYLMFTLLVLHAISLRKNFENSDVFTKVYLLSSLFVTSYIYFLTSLNVDYLTIRYLYIPIVLFLLFAYINALATAGLYKRVAVCFLTVVAAVGVGSQNILIGDDPAIARNAATVALLKKNTSGTFAGTYWNAQKYEFLSDGQLKALPILLDPSVCVKSFNWLIDTERTSSKSKIVPILLDDFEFKTLQNYGCSKNLQFIVDIEGLKLFHYQGTW